MTDVERVDSPSFTLLKGLYECLMVVDGQVPTVVRSKVFGARLRRVAEEVQRRTGYQVYDGLMTIAGKGDGTTTRYEPDQDNVVGAYRGFTVNLETGFGTTPYEDIPAFHTFPLRTRILYTLIVNEGRIVTYSKLIDFAWGPEGGDRNLLKCHISRLRPIIGDRTELVDGKMQPRHIRGVPFFGYQFHADPVESSSSGT